MQPPLLQVSGGSCRVRTSAQRMCDSQGALRPLCTNAGASWEGPRGWPSAQRAPEAAPELQVFKKTVMEVRNTLKLNARVGLKELCMQFGCAPQIFATSASSTSSSIVRCTAPLCTADPY